MCGIVGYIGRREAAPLLENGLRRMEYRGYDSAGIALVEAGSLQVIKRQGKVEELVLALKKQHNEARLGIGHTRWATHGAPSEKNAHPHVAGKIALVHNGIIENYSELKSELAASGVEFASDTDSEVIAWLIDREYKGNKSLAEAVLAALQHVVGTFGIAVVSSSEPTLLVAARRGSPLLLGISEDELFVASDASAIVGHSEHVVYLEDDEVAICTPGQYRIVDLDNVQRERQAEPLTLKLEAIEKGGYDHFLLKEIMEQPKTIEDILRGRLDRENGTVHLGGLNLTDAHLRNTQRILTVGCGTAFYAGMVGKYLLERLTGVPVDVEYGSEFRYREPALTPRTTSLIVTQSGETADTLASLREMKRRGIKSLGLVNVVGSSVAREVDGGIYLHAGPEISVASTKAFTGQVIAQLLFGLKLARSRDLGVNEGREVVDALESLPSIVTDILKQAEQIQAIAKRLAKFDNAMYLGRDSLFPVALEGSHKLKEISYIHAEAYPAGEMKHGANALIDHKLLVVFLAPKNSTYSKSKSNLEEVRARNGHVLTIATEGDIEIERFSNETIYIPPVSPWIEPIVANIPLQLLAYYMAVERGTDVDQPRNLAKSVTVE